MQTVICPRISGTSVSTTATVHSMRRCLRAGSLDARDRYAVLSRRIITGVVDLAMNYQIADATKVYLKANNIFNQFYAEHSNVKWGAPGEWWTAPGRNFMIGLEQSF